MYNSVVHNKIELLGQVISDLKDIELALQCAGDPALIHEYKLERDNLMKELNEVSGKCIILIEAYLSDCKDHNIPPYLDYFRVLRELRKSTVILC